MTHRATACCLAALAAAGVLVACSADDDASSVTVFAASSTRVLNEGIEERAAQQNPTLTLTFHNDGSTSLVSQLLDGAPADILITADAFSMEIARNDGTVEKPRAFAANEMVMVVHPERAGEITSIEDTLAGDVNLVLCDSNVPCGRLSQTLSEENRINVAPVSLEHSVGDVLGKVTTGEADAGWVYRTDAQAAGAAVDIVEIPRANEHPNTLYAAVATDSRNPEQAQRFLDMLTGDESAELLLDAGFVLPAVE